MNLYPTGEDLGAPRRPPIGPWPLGLTEKGRALATSQTSSAPATMFAASSLPEHDRKTRPAASWLSKRGYG